jgi:hypothetical protein
MVQVVRKKIFKPLSYFVDPCGLFLSFCEGDATDSVSTGHVSVHIVNASSQCWEELGSR